MAIEVRPIRESELRPWLEAVETSFGDEVRDERFADFRRIVEVERVLGAYDGEQVVGGGAAFSFRLTVPGPRQVAAAGVTAVGVLPTHRRQGMLRQLMSRQLADVRARGEQVAILWASEGSIYQRFGYGLASLNGPFEIERERSTFRIAGQPSGSVRMVTHDEAAEAFPPIYDAVRAVTPGFYERSADWWQANILSDYPATRRGASRMFLCLHEREGAPTGYAIYRIKADWGELGTKSVLQVVESIAVDPMAERDVWRFLFDVDLIANIRSHVGPVPHPLLLTLDDPRRLGLKVGDGLWLRLLDVAAALEGRGYAADGTVVLDVVDDMLPDVGGRFRLTARGGAGSVEPTADGPDIELDVTDLASVYLGAFAFSDLARAGRTVEAQAGARARADAIFASAVRPWCPEIF
jgi:predicted acetyltransferase